VSLLLANGYQPKAQHILAKAGGTPASLDRGRLLFDQWLAAEEAVKRLNAQKQAARQAEDRAYQAAAAEVGDLIETIYHYFNDDTAILAQVGLRQRDYQGPKGKTAPGQAAPTQPAAGAAVQPAPTAIATAATTAAQPTANGRPKRDYQSRAEISAAWHMLCANVQKLDPAALERIAHQEWTLDRCQAAAALVDALAQADRDQQAAISAYHSQVDQARQARLALVDWYWPIVKLARRAIRKLPLEQRTQYKTLLGL
jgi:hypothetical protein